MNATLFISVRMWWLLRVMLATHGSHSNTRQNMNIMLKKGVVDILSVRIIRPQINRIELFDIVPDSECHYLVYP